MEKEEFAIALSEREGEGAIREVSLKIKSIIPKQINHLIVLFTPHYNPSTILDTIKLTLQPQKVLGLAGPFLIFEGRIIQKGIVACCINKGGMEWNENYCESKDPQEIEFFLNSSLKKLKRKEINLLSAVSYQINPFTYINKVKLSLGKAINFLGCGYMKKYSDYNSQIINDTLKEGLVNIAIKGIKISSLKSGGYLPVGKPFTITKAAPGRGIINEINEQPAIDIYKHYLEEKFEIFKKNHLFSFYPLGIINDGSLRLINVIDYLEDGSLMCIGEAKEKDSGYVLFFDSDLLLKKLEDTLATIKAAGQGLIFIINSLTRKRILKEISEREIKLTKQILGDKFKMIGLYCDYSFFSEEKTREIALETGDSLITLWN